MRLRGKLGLWAAMLACVPGLHAAAAPGNSASVAGPGVLGWHVSLRNGFDYICARMEPQGEKMRLYLHAKTNDSLDIATADVVAVEPVELPLDPPVVAAQPSPVIGSVAKTQANGRVNVAPLAEDSARLVNVDKDIILSIIHAESAENPRAVSRVGAQGLMQLMPATAGNMGIHDAFDPAKNVDGGTAYFEYLLERYHDNLPNAVAAYNAGPGAVDKYHGIPPFRETQAYVRRVIKEFNRRKLLAAHGAPTAEASLQLASLAGR